MLKARTIACPKCATRLRVRSLDAVSETDACPECGAPLKPTADQQSADLLAAEAEPLHPALADTRGTSRRRPGPAGIAAAVTGLLGLVIVVPLLMGSLDSQPDEGSLPGNTEAATSESQSPGTEAETVSIVAKGDRPNPIEPASPPPDDDGSNLRESTPDTVAEHTTPPEKPSVPDFLNDPDTIKVAVGRENPAEKSPIQQTSVASEVPGRAPDKTTGKPATPPAVSRPASPPQPTIDERLDVPIEKFELNDLVTVKSVLETVEIMANLRIDISPELEEVIADREVAFSLENTSAREILNEAAKRSDLIVTVRGDRLTLTPAAR